jgi:hypothetical protein
MIKLDIQYVIFFYVALTLMGIMALWIFLPPTPRPKIRHNEKADIWKCGICSNDYVDSTSEDISRCPLCGSYNKRPGAEVDKN